MLSYSCQNIDQSDLDAVMEALRGPFLTGGAKVEEFEEALAAYVGTRAACVVNSATSALHLAYLALDIRDKVVLTTPLSFIATSNAAVMAGAKVEFIDVGRDGNISAAKLRARLEAKSDDVGAVAVVDYAGQSVEIDEIAALCAEFNLPLLDDASHALGAEFRGEKVGKKATLSVFSFHPVKPITTFEGGAVVSDDESLIARIKTLRSHAIIKKRLWDSDSFELGFNYRLSDVACALGLNQLAKLDANLEKREQIAAFYDKEFHKNPYFSALEIAAHKKSSRHLYPILLYPQFWCQKEELFAALLEAGIGVQVHYKPTYAFGFYKKMLGAIYLKNADDFYKAELSIPCHQEMSLAQARFVRDTLFSLLEKSDPRA